MQVRVVAVAVLVAGAIAAVPSRAQTPATASSGAQPAPAQSSAELSTHDLAPTFSTKVNLVMVPVVVRDSHGRAVGTLQKDDFRLFDRAKPQVITRFSVEKAGEPAIPAEIAQDADDAALTHSAGAAPARPAAPIAQRFVLYLFDDVHTKNEDLLQVRIAADKHIAEALNPTTRDAIFTTSGQGNLDFTDDGAQLHEALMKLMARPTMSAPGSECPDISYYWADLIYNKNDQGATQAAVNMTMGNCTPAPATNTPQAIQAAIQMATNTAQGTAARIVSGGDRETRLAFVTIENAIRRLAAAPGDRTLVLVSSGFYIGDDLRSEESEIMDRAIRANVRISTLNARGLYVLIPGGDASTPTPFGGSASLIATQQYREQSASIEEGTLEELADATGGRFFHNNNDLKGGLDQIAAPPEFVYLLGFSPQNLKMDGGYHKLKVTLVNPHGLDLEARRGYYAPKHLPNPEEDAKREIQEALFSRDEMQDIPIDLHMQFFKTSDIAAKIAVLAHVNVKNLRFRKADGRNNDNLIVTSGLFDRNGNFVTGLQKIVELRLLDATLDKLLNAGITVRSNFDAAPGSYVIRLVIRDSEGETMAARNGVVEIP